MNHPSSMVPASPHTPAARRSFSPSFTRMTGGKKRNIRRRQPLVETFEYQVSSRHVLPAVLSVLRTFQGYRAALIEDGQEV